MTGKTVADKTQDWLKEIVEPERKCHLDFFGQKFGLTEFKKTLNKYGRQKIKRWQKLGLEPHFLPDVVMGKNVYFPGWKVKPNKWYYDEADEGNILRVGINGESVVDKKPFELEGITVLIDIRPKPRYNDGKQMYQDDNLLAAVIEKLRKDGRIEEYKYGPPSSRFGVSSDEWEKAIRPALAEKLGLEVNQVRLERVVEANVIPQLYPDMPRKDDGATNTCVWYEEYLEGRAHRLYGGDSEDGGLANVDSDSAVNQWIGKSFRPLAVL